MLVGDYYSKFHYVASKKQAGNCNTLPGQQHVSMKYQLKMSLSSFYILDDTDAHVRMAKRAACSA